MFRSLPHDAALVYIASGLRAASISLAGVLIAIYLANRGLSPSQIGVIIAVGMTAGAAGTVIVGLYADRWGRRRTLRALAVLNGIGFIAFGMFDTMAALVITAGVTLLNGMGRDRGPASALEQALLPATTSDTHRTWTMAWYNAAVDVGHAIGAGAALIGAHGSTFVWCGIALAASAIPYAFLGPTVEAPLDRVAPRHDAAQDAHTRRVIHRLAALFGIDSTGGGFLSSALVAYWFFERYGLSEGQLAAMFFAARLLNVLSHLSAAWLARRVGLLNTMVFTHLPSSIFLMLAPTASSAGTAAALFLAREALVEMDVPTRQSYVMAVVPPSARSYASAMTNVARNAGWAVGPVIGGAVMQHVALAAPLFIGGSLKIAYDLILYRSFRHLRPPEERPGAEGSRPRR